MKVDKYFIGKLLSLMIITGSISSTPVYNAAKIGSYLNESSSELSVESEIETQVDESEVDLEIESEVDLEIESEVDSEIESEVDSEIESEVDSEIESGESETDNSEKEGTEVERTEKAEPVLESQIPEELKEGRFSQCSFTRDYVYELQQIAEGMADSSDEGKDTKTFSNPRIDKEIIDESGVDDGVLEPGETVTYGVCIDNPSNLLMSHKVIFRDSLVENLPPQYNYNYIGAWSNRLEFVSGSLDQNGLTIGKMLPSEWAYFKYQVTYKGGVTPGTVLQNSVVWDGSNPNSYYCDTSSGYKDRTDCEEIRIGDDNGGGNYGGLPFIKKEIVAESGITPGVWEANEDITYRLTVTNFDQYSSAYNVRVRDSMLESMPQGFSLVSAPSVNVPYGTSGSLTNGTFTISSLGPSSGSHSSATIEYTVRYNGGLAEGTVIRNVATDDGQVPSLGSVCVPSDAYNVDVTCEDITTGTGTVPPSGDPDLQVSKEIINQSITDDDNVDIGEAVTYQIKVTNFGEGDATEIRVRDSMLANIPSELSLNGDVQISSPDSYYSGTLENDDFKIEALSTNQTVTITYTLVYNGGYSDGYRIDNVVTTDGSDPTSISTCNPTNGYVKDVDCEEISAFNNEYVNLTKTGTDRGDNVVQPGEYLYYTVNYQSSNFAGTQLIDTPDSSVIDPSSTTLISAKANGVEMDPSDYTAWIADGKNNIVFSEVPGTEYEFTYYTKVLDAPAQKDAVVNTVKLFNPSSPPAEATWSLPTDFSSKSKIVKSVSDETKDGIAQPEEFLEYTINYFPEIGGTAVITDVLSDPNLKNEYRNLLVFEDGNPLSSDRYTLLDSKIIISDTKPESKYTIIFETQVVETVNTAYSTIENTATAIADGAVIEEVSDSITIPVTSTPMIDSPALSYTARESDLATEADGDGIAEPGEYIFYSISFNSKLIRNRTFINQFDENLDVMSIKDFKFNSNGSEVAESDYAVNANASTNLGILKYDNVTKNEQLNVTYKIQVKEPVVNSDASVITNVIAENASHVSEKATIALDPSAEIPEKEQLIIEVIGEQSVSPGDQVRFRVKIPSLITATDTINISSPIENAALTFVSVDGVYVDGSSIVDTDWSNDPTNGLDLTINRDLAVGTDVEAQFTLKLADNAPINSSFGIGAWGKSGEYETNKDIVYISTGTNDVSNAPDVFAEFSIASEAGGTITNQIESGENIIYELSLESMSDEPITITVTDALEAQQMSHIASWYDDDKVSVISNITGLEDEYLMSQLETGITLTIEPNEEKLVRFLITGKDVMEELDINPADGDPDEAILNTIEVSQATKSTIYPGTQIALPYMNGELAVGKRASTTDGDNVLQADGSENIEYKITVVNKGTREARGIFVQDQLDDQQIELIADTTNMSEIPVVSSGNGAIITANPTVGTLMDDTGIEVTIPAGDYITLEFAIPSKAFDPDSIDLDADGTADGKFTNTAFAYDSTSKTSYPEAASIYFSDPMLGSVKYDYTNELGDGMPLIEGFDMVNTLSVQLADSTEYLSGFISYDNRYLNDVRVDNMEFYLNGSIVDLPFETEYIKQGNTTTATFKVNNDFNVGDEIKIVVYQSPKDALYENTSLRYSINNARLFVDDEKTDVYMDTFELI